ncbi:MAG: alcohol dehydrogenase catalytic domain-containing protein, partial [Sphaerochaetaceae bacterium]
MNKKMKAAVMTALNEIEIQEKDIPKPKADEVLIKVDYVGICGSDLHYLEHGSIGNFVVEYP